MGVTGVGGEMVSRNDILSARDASLACLDSLLDACDQLEKRWRVKWDGVGKSCAREFPIEPRSPNDTERFMDDGLRHLTTQGRTSIHLSAKEGDDQVAIGRSCRLGPTPRVAEMESFLETAMALVEDMRRYAAVAMDEALTDDVCAVVERAQENTVVLAGRSYSCCHLAAVDHVARFSLCWPGSYPFPEVMQKLREAASEPVEELREIAAGIRAEAAAAIRMLPDHQGAVDPYQEPGGVGDGA